MLAEAERNGVEAITAVGTAGLRAATNASELADRAGVIVEVISGQEEARLAYRAATAELESGTGSLAVFDTGGGSSQFSFGRADRVDERFSVSVGAVRFTERYGLDGATSVKRLEDALAQIAGELVVLAGRPRPELVIGMGGAITNLAAVRHGLLDYDPEVVHGTTLDRNEIDRQIELYRRLDRRQRQAIDGLQPARADVILAGACIVRVVLTILGADALTVCDRGLRHGLLAERFALEPPAPAHHMTAV
jgi:exopolyphosphatase/guanosine-5'-triphosphate,3'-diphosphate pyrophosphatase